MAQVMFIGLGLMVAGIVVVVGPLSGIGGPGQELAGSDLIQYCLGAGSAVIGAIMCGVADAIEARRQCPRCRRSDTWGLYCDECSREIGEKNN